MPFTTVLTLEIPETDVNQVTSTLRDDISLLEVVWAGAEAGTSTITIEDVSVKRI